MEMGMNWATPMSVGVEKRRGQIALPAPLARANFQTSFNLTQQGGTSSPNIHPRPIIAMSAFDF